MRFIYPFSLLITILLCSCSPQKNRSTYEETTEETQALPEAPRWICDLEQIFSENEKAELNQIADSLFGESKQMCMLLTIKSYEPYNSLNEYTDVIDKQWGDKGQNYIIIILSVRMSEIRIVTGTETEKKLPQGFTDNIIQSIMFPQFQNEQYFDGIKECIQKYIDFFNQKT